MSNDARPRPDPYARVHVYADDVPDAASSARDIMLSCFAAPEPEHAYCGDCHGKGFDRTSRKGSRHARRCQRCRGKGRVAVGNTKR